LVTNVQWLVEQEIIFLEDLAWVCRVPDYWDSFNKAIPEETEDWPILQWLAEKDVSSHHMQSELKKLHSSVLAAEVGIVSYRSHSYFKQSSAEDDQFHQSGAL